MKLTMLLEFLQTHFSVYLYAISLKWLIWQLVDTIAVSIVIVTKTKTENSTLEELK